MPREVMTVRVEPRTRKALDGIASALDRDRIYVVNQALQSYIDVHRWHIEHIQRGLREANAGKFAPKAEVDRVTGRFRRK